MKITITLNVRVNLNVEDCKAGNINKRFPDGGHYRDIHFAAGKAALDCDVNGGLDIDCTEEETVAAIEMAKHLQKDLDRRIEDIRHDMDDIKYNLDKLQRKSLKKAE